MTGSNDIFPIRSLHNSVCGEDETFSQAQKIFPVTRQPSQLPLVGQFRPVGSNIVDVKILGLEYERRRRETVSILNAVHEMMRSAKVDFIIIPSTTLSDPAMESIVNWMKLRRAGREKRSARPSPHAKKILSGNFML